jgi:parvulin-like peptidyl-prolyl isomerase
LGAALPPAAVAAPEYVAPPEPAAAKPTGSAAPSSLPELPAEKAAAGPPLLSLPVEATPSLPMGAAPEVSQSTPVAKPAASAAPAPDAAPIESAPAPAAPAGPATKAQTAPKSGGSPPPEVSAASEDDGKSAAAIDAAGAAKLAAVLPLEAAPPMTSVSPAVTARAAAPGPAPPKRDSQIVRTAAQKPVAEATPRRPRTPDSAGRPVARVGDEIITYHDLVVATKENLQKIPDLLAAYRDPAERAEASVHINRLSMETLTSLIDRTLLVQEAKRLVKEPKMLDGLYEEADRVFRENEVAPLLRKFNLESEQQLSDRLAENGRSLDAMRQAFRQYFLAESYIHQKLKDHLKIELPELLKYYNERLDKHEFDRPAQITWRELVVEAAKYKNREEAQRKAAGLLERLRRGEDFATLARAESDGLTRSRNQGGLMQTSPGGYGIAAVNRAIESMPIGQTSDVIEGPASFHIVRVEGRRPAGAASFEEVQDQLRPVLENKKYQEARAKYLAKLHRSTLITIYSIDKNNRRREEAKTRSTGTAANGEQLKVKGPSS